MDNIRQAIRIVLLLVIGAVESIWDYLVSLEVWLLLSLPAWFLCSSR